MVPSALLKAFEPLDAFEDDERAYWERYATDPPPVRLRSVIVSHQESVGAAIATTVAEREHADVIERDGRIYVCPHRTRLRMLASVVAFHRTMDPEVADAFLPPNSLERSVEELDRLRAEHPGWHNHILQSAWEVPLRWFVLFNEDERTMVPGPRPALRYETSMAKARRRVADALGILRKELPNPSVVTLVADLARWVTRFHDASRVVLDYGEVASLFDANGLLEDLSCSEIWAAIDALREGDQERSAAYYAMAAGRWSRMRAMESAN